MEIIHFEEVPIPMVKKILEEELKKQEELGIRLDMSSLAYRTRDYVKTISKCSSEGAERAFRKLTSMGLKGITAAILINVVPKSVDEARILLNFESKTFTTEEIEQLLQILKEECEGS